MESLPVESTQRKMLSSYRDMSPIIVVLSLLAVTDSQGAKWTYTGPDGEQHWPKHFPFCGGVFQSPIDLQTHLFRYDPTLAPIQVWNYNLSFQEQLTLGNNGHSVQLSLPPSMHFSGGLPHRYSAAQLHLHWGSPSMPGGSEHTVNGRQFAAEMHVVHFNSDKYPNISIAADKSDGLAVLGVLIEVGKFNAGFDQFLKYLNNIKYKDQKLKVPAFNIRDLLPARLDEFYRYDGSLTTPPCYPSVLWTVFRTPVSLSQAQFQALASALYSSGEQDTALVAMSRNYRKPQQADDRIVLVSFQDGRGSHRPVTVTSPLLRQRVLQQLLAGDLADLADEGLHWLLPNLGHGDSQSPAPRGPQLSLAHAAEELWRGAVWQGAGLGAGSMLWKNRHTPGMAQDGLCYVALEQKLARQLHSSHTGTRLVAALRDTLFPDLNLRSYLACRSDLALPTIRQILRARPSDEANELHQSLARAVHGPRRGHPRKHRGRAPPPAPPAAHSQNHIQARWHHGPLQGEWED
ncbi:hypothetical protein AGOR_G00162740 [Albula goreensis]|uniref:Carbonic anhydrase n=1 Tax=Albula goreensis TaxID=1534307 RepID=A0A8T3D3R1_9TELE|nr:hypothetical protein AGOR_G00162740 [Albula goreensis]